MPVIKPMKLSEIQAIFWDFDGVIVNSTEVKTHAFEEMFAPYGREISMQVVDYHEQFGGISRMEKIDYSHRHLIGQPLSPEELEEKGVIFSGLVKQKVIDAEMIPGAALTLENLHGRVPMFVISGTPQDELIDITNSRDLSRYFKRVLGSPVLKVPHVENLLQEFNLDPAFCIFVGDALTDLKAANATGIHFIGIEGSLPFPEGTTVLPDCTGIIDHLQTI